MGFSGFVRWTPSRSCFNPTGHPGATNLERFDSRVLRLAPHRHSDKRLQEPAALIVRTSAVSSSALRSSRVHSPLDPMGSRRLS